jgi:hypothetical protein
MEFRFDVRNAIPAGVGPVAGALLDNLTRRLALETRGKIQTRGFAPVDTGRLSNSFGLARDGVALYRVWSGVEYAMHVHEGRGRGRRKPNRYAARAAADVNSRIPEIVADCIRQTPGLSGAGSV